MRFFVAFTLAAVLCFMLWAAGQNWGARRVGAMVFRAVTNWPVVVLQFAIAPETMIGKPVVLTEVPNQVLKRQAARRTQ